MTTSEDLRAKVAEDTARSRELLAKRDDARRGRDHPDEALALAVEAQHEARRLVSTDELVAGDITSDGHLVRKTLFRITGWRTKDERENGTKREAISPASVGLLVWGLLEDGHYQVIVDSQPPPGTP